ncbi:MAG: alpha/beta hydrolase [Hyphomonadaceae bacterium]|nr:alpha/beta hydrolase [Hyphomonadaceae bacterium]
MLRPLFAALLLSSVCVPAACAKQPPAAAAQPAPGLFSEAISGKRGAAAPVVLIPGLLSPAAAWDDVRPALEETHEVRSLTLAGMAGQPAREWEGNFVEAQGRAIAAHLRAAGVRNATVIGHSIGGVAALAAALEGPDVIGKVVIVDSVPFTAAWLSGGQVQTLEQANLMAGALQAQMGGGEWAATVKRNEAGYPIQSRDPAFYPKISAWALASEQQVVARAMGDLLRLDLRARLSAMKQPTLVLMGYEEGFTPVPKAVWLAAAKQQYGAAPNVEVRVIEPSRHWVQHDQPQALLAAVEPFLAQP